VEIERRHRIEKHPSHGDAAAVAHGIVLWLSLNFGK